MARFTDQKCRLCRREGIKLFLKGTRCDGPKCSITRREYPPGQHTWRRAKPSDYGTHLREKQKTKRFYQVVDRQFMKVYDEAARFVGNTGVTLLRFLEQRLDNVVLQLGFATSRPQARQLVDHGHIHVNGRRVDIPSYRVKAGDVVTASSREAIQKFVKANLEVTQSRKIPTWLEMDATKMEGRVVQLPQREDIGAGDRQIPIREQLIVELCSR